MTRYASGVGSIPGGSTFPSCSFAISEVFGRNGMIQRSLIKPELIGLRTKIIGVPTVGLPAVIRLSFSMIISYSSIPVNCYYIIGMPAK